MKHITLATLVALVALVGCDLSPFSTVQHDLGAIDAPGIDLPAVDAPAVDASDDDDAALDAGIHDAVADAALHRALISIRGQSNAEGRKRCADVTLTTDLCDAYPAVTLSDEVTDSPLDPFSWQLSRILVPLSPRVGDQFGVELSLGRALTMAGHAVDIDKAGVGSTTIAIHWGLPACESSSPSPAKCYPSSGPDLPTRAAIHTAETASALGDDVQIIVWIQGEADAGYNLYSHAYAANLKALFQRFHVEQPGAKIVFNQLSSIAGGDYNSVVRAQQAVVAADPELTPYVTMISSEGLPCDSAHYTADGYYQLGLRFADAIGPLLLD